MRTLMILTRGQHPVDLCVSKANGGDLPRAHPPIKKGTVLIGGAYPIPRIRRI